MKINATNSQPIIVGKYAFKTPHCDNGVTSQVYKGLKIVDDGKNYILKRYNKPISLTLGGLIEREVNNSKSNLYPNCVVNFVEKIEDEKSINLIYDYFISKNLKQFLAVNKGNLNLETKMKIAWNISNAINLLHANKWIHGKIQPFHILVNELENIKFTGLKYMSNLNLNQYFVEKIGTYPYVAPEIQITGAIGNFINEKIDVYCLGIILYFLFTGSEDITQIDKKLKEQNFIIPEGMKHLINKCKNANPNYRPDSKEITNPSYYNIDFEHRSNTIIINPNPLIQEVHESNPVQIQQGNDLINERDSLEPYQIIELLGSGNFGNVSKIMNCENKKTYVIKQIKMEKLNTPKAKELIYNESLLLKELRDLSFVTKIEETFYYQKRLCMILEFCNGGNLECHVNWLRKNKMKMNLEDIKLIASNLAEGMHILHSKNIVHRDLKPENILLIINEYQAIIDSKICDLGLSKKLQANCPGFDTKVGTAMYQAPEFREDFDIPGTPLTNKVDVYSYGLILFFMVFENHAYYIYDKSQFIKGNFKLPEINPKPNTLKEYTYLITLIQSCLVKDPNKRPSFEQILKHEFFNSIKIPQLSSVFSLSPSKLLRNGYSSKGYTDQEGKIYFKSYDQTSLQSNTNLKYLKRLIQFLLVSKNTPHIVPFLQYGLIQNSVVFAFEYCNGHSLQEYALKKGINLSEKVLKLAQVFDFNEIKVVARSLIEFIDDMHGRNYLHRNINPKHILLIMENNLISKIKVCGLKTAKSENNANESLIPATENIRFSDPLAVGNGFCEDSDIWSIGMVIYFMTFGQLPSNNFNQLKAIREKGIIYFPSSKEYPNLHSDNSIQSFIEFCIARRNPGELSNKLIVDLLKPTISWFN